MPSTWPRRTPQRKRWDRAACRRARCREKNYPHSRSRRIFFDKLWGGATSWSPQVVAQFKTVLRQAEGSGVKLKNVINAVDPRAGTTLLASILTSGNIFALAGMVLMMPSGDYTVNNVAIDKSVGDLAKVMIAANGKAGGGRQVSLEASNGAKAFIYVQGPGLPMSMSTFSSKHIVLAHQGGWSLETETSVGGVDIHRPLKSKGTLSFANSTLTGTFDEGADGALEVNGGPAQHGKFSYHPDFSFRTIDKSGMLTRVEMKGQSVEVVSELASEDPTDLLVVAFQVKVQQAEIKNLHAEVDDLREQIKTLFSMVAEKVATAPPSTNLMDL